MPGLSIQFCATQGFDLNLLMLIRFSKYLGHHIPVLMQGDKIRRQNDWDKWVIPPESNPDVASSPASVTSHPDVKDLTAHLGGVGLHESASSSVMVDQNHHEVLQNGAPSGDNQGPVVEDNSGHQ
jgi:la-related protein 1